MALKSNLSVQAMSVYNVDTVVQEDHVEDAGPNALAE